MAVSSIIVVVDTWYTRTVSSAAGSELSIVSSGAPSLRAEVGDGPGRAVWPGIQGGRQVSGEGSVQVDVARISAVRANSGLRSTSPSSPSSARCPR